MTDDEYYNNLHGTSYIVEYAMSKAIFSVFLTLRKVMVL